MSRSLNDALARFIAKSEDLLMARVLELARQQDYTRYTSTLVEAWRLSISGISAALIEALERLDEVPELHPDDDFLDDPMSAFGVLEAQRHRERGISLPMFLGLFKYYRQTYLDVVDSNFGVTGNLWIDRCFDRMEIAFVSQWGQIGKGDELTNLQQRNRATTNEKNRLLTVVESLSNPALLVDEQDRVIYRNTATSTLINRSSEYYQAPVNPFQEGLIAAVEHRERLVDILPWLATALATHKASGEKKCEEDVSVGDKPEEQRHYVVQLATMRDVSGKYPGTVILVADVTDRRRAEDRAHRLNRQLQARNEALTSAMSRIRTLEGILPICAGCKKIRDEEERWVEVEVYVGERTEADFSHGICPDCMKRLYPEDPSTS